MEPSVAYTQERQADDRDLVMETVELLKSKNITPEKLLEFTTNHHIVEAQNKIPEVQRYLLNRYWALQLMQASRVSIDERYCLIPNGSLDDWKRLFETKVLPFVVNYGKLFN